MIKDMNQQRRDKEVFSDHGIYLIYIDEVVVYVGSSIDFMKRKSNHLSTLRKHKHGNEFLQQLYDQHGEEKLIFHVVPETTLINPVDLYIYEAEYLFKYRKTAVNMTQILSTTKLIRKGKVKEKLTAEMSERFSGENNPACKITEAQAIEIIQLKKNKTMLQKDIAEKFGISIGQVSKIGRTKWLNLI